MHGRRHRTLISNVKQPEGTTQNRFNQIWMGSGQTLLCMLWFQKALTAQNLALISTYGSYHFDECYLHFYVTEGHDTKMSLLLPVIDHTSTMIFYWLFISIGLDLAVS